jgi:predicted DNA-binding protein (UPF0251 family)
MRRGREVYQVDPRPWSVEKGRPGATAIDPEAVQRLQAEGLSQRAIARRLGIPRSTLQDHLKRTQAVDLRCGGNTLILPQRGPRPPQVSPVPETPAALEGVVADLLEVAQWWRTRKLPRVSPGPPQETQR